LRRFVLTTAVAGSVDMTITGFVDSDGVCVYRKNRTGDLRTTVFAGSLTDLTDSYSALPGYTLTYLDTSMGAISSVSPSSGTASGGTAITILGAGFKNATGATLGGVAVTSFVVVSDTKITCVTGAHSAGAVTLAIQITGSSDATLASAYTYV
jgi:hypothetical protein